MNITVQRFDEQDAMYSDAMVTNNDIHKGVVGTFGFVFGQLLDDQGKFICYTLERKDTLISEGTRKYKLYYSPANRCVVPIFEDAPGSGTYDRCFEMHPANFPYELKGCTAVGLGLTQVELTQSKAAFSKIMALLNGNEGTVTHEKRVAL